MNIFETPMWRYRYPNDTSDMISTIYKMYNDEGGSNIESLGGFKSTNMQLHLHPSFIPLKEYIEHLTSDIVESSSMFNMWFNIHKKNQKTVVHNHYGEDGNTIGIISGVVYLNKKPNMGNLVFIDDKPRTIAEDILLPKYNIVEVQTNDIVLFPSWVSHSGELNETDEDRITVAFNIGLKNE